MKKKNEKIMRKSEDELIKDSGLMNIVRKYEQKKEEERLEEQRRMDAVEKKYAKIFKIEEDRINNKHRDKKNDKNIVAVNKYKNYKSEVNKIFFDEFIKFRKSYGNYYLSNEPSESLLNDFNNLKWRKRVGRFKPAFEKLKWKKKKRLFLFNLEFFLSFFLYLLEGPSNKKFSISVFDKVKFESKKQYHFFLQKFKKKVLQKYFFKGKRQKKKNDIILHKKAVPKVLSELSGYNYDYDYYLFWTIVTWKKFLHIFPIYYFNCWIRTYYLCSLAANNVDIAASFGPEFSIHNNYPLFRDIDYLFEFTLYEAKVNRDLFLLNTQILYWFPARRINVKESLSLDGKVYASYLTKDYQWNRRAYFDERNDFEFSEAVLKKSFPELYKKFQERLLNEKKKRKSIFRPSNYKRYQKYLLSNNKKLIKGFGNDWNKKQYIKLNSKYE